MRNAIAASYRPHRSFSCATTRPGDPSRSPTGKAVMQLISHNYEITTPPARSSAVFVEACFALLAREKDYTITHKYEIVH
jgi:hypothetical protein